MKMTGKFLAERKDIPSETGSQKIRHLGVSRNTISLVPRALLLYLYQKRKNRKKFECENNRDMDEVGCPTVR